jgi:hypothetical protein
MPVACPSDRAEHTKTANAFADNALGRWGRTRRCSLCGSKITPTLDPDLILFLVVRQGFRFVLLPNVLCDLRSYSYVTQAASWV